MATKEDLFYKPSISAPEKERDERPDSVSDDYISSTSKSSVSGDSGDMNYGDKVSTTSDNTDTINRSTDKSSTGSTVGASGTTGNEYKYIDSADNPDPYLAYASKFASYNSIAKEIKARAKFLIDMTIEDLDLYVADAPFHVLKLISDLTDISFKDSNGNFLPDSDPIYTLNPQIVKCIYRVAGTSDPYREESKLIDAAKNLDSDAVKQSVNDSLKSKVIEPIFYGIHLLTVVLKMSYVIAIHYTVGWSCAYFKGKLTISIRIRKVRFRKSWSIGNKISHVFRSLEERLLWLNGWIGYRCNDSEEPPKSCNDDEWRDIDFKRVNCCSASPIFFGPASSDVSVPSSYAQASCFEKFVRSEVDPTYAGARTICSLANSADETIKPTEYEKAASCEIARYLNNKSSKSGTMGMGAENIQTLTKAIDLAEVGVTTTDTIQSSIFANKAYSVGQAGTSKWDCFGLESKDDGGLTASISSAINNVAGTWLPKGNGQPIIGQTYFDFLDTMDSTLSEILKAADKSVSCVANLAKWGSSKQLCCYVYLLTAIASIWHALIEKGVWCPDMDDGEAVRNAMHLRWAKELKNSKNLQELVALLQVIKQIVDIFIKRMGRQVLIAGFTLPLKEMWEMIKVTLANGLSEYLDVLLGPLDRVISGLQTVPEIRHMINNECFGFDKFLKFLMCLLGNLKWSIVNQIMKLLDFNVADITLMQDILLTRMRLKSLESLSKLLGALINLILGLKDCYTADELVNSLTSDKDKKTTILERMAADANRRSATMTPLSSDLYSQNTDIIGLIVSQEVANEYAAAVALANLAGSPENLKKFEEYSIPLIADSNTFSEDEQNYLDSLQASISSQFGDFGQAAKDIFNNAMSSASVDVTAFINPETNEVISYGEFVIMMEQMTGISVGNIKESLRYIFDILRGQDETA